MMDLDEIERRIPSPATECAFCHRLATAVCPVCGTMTCEDHRRFHARDAVGTDCDGVAMIPAHHDAATMDRVALVAEVRRHRAYMAEIGAEDVRCTCGSGAHPRHCKRHPWGFAAHVAELNSDNAGDWMNEAMDMERERDESRAESGRLRAALVEVERHIGCLSHLAAGRACEVITRALHPDAPAVSPATLGAGPRDADGREVTT